MKKHIVLAVASAAVLGATGAAAGTFWYLDQHPTAVTAAPSTPTPPPPAPLGPPLAPGMYNFVILGGNTMPVALQPCGDGCLALDQGPSEANPNGFRQEIKLVGARYTGQTMSERGIVCISDGKPRAAETRYSVNSDGTDGLVEVLGQPCGPDAPNVPLAFNLTLVPSP